MPVLIQQNNESTIIAENADVSLNLGFGSKSQDRIIASPLQAIHLLPPVRKEKILAVRQQLAEGTYDLDKGLDVVVGQLLKALKVYV